MWSCETCELHVGSHVGVWSCETCELHVGSHVGVWSCKTCKLLGNHEGVWSHKLEAGAEILVRRPRPTPITKQEIEWLSNLQTDLPRPIHSCLCCKWPGAPHSWTRQPISPHSHDPQAYWCTGTLWEGQCVYYL